MFSPVILILVSIWTATYGDTVCETLSGVPCDFPFRRTAKGPLFNTCQRGAGGRTWCATSKLPSEVYDKWGYCNPKNCTTWEVPSIEEARQMIQQEDKCFDCIDSVATGPPHNPISLDCLLPCVFKRNNAKCHFLLLTTGTRMCLGSCGFETRELSLASQPACIQVSEQFTATAKQELKSFDIHSASLCGEICAKTYPTQCDAWNWNSPQVATNKNLCTCIQGKGLTTTTVPLVFSGPGPAAVQGQCPPK